MNKEEFEEQYAKKSGITVQKLHSLGLSGYPCDCGEGGCQGWQMQTKEFMQREYSKREDSFEKSGGKIIKSRITDVTIEPPKIPMKLDMPILEAQIKKSNQFKQSKREDAFCKKCRCPILPGEKCSECLLDEVVFGDFK